MKYVLIFISSLLLYGCASDGLQKSLDEIVAIYEGKTSISKEINDSTGDKTIHNLKIIVQESALIDSIPPSNTSANIALMVYEGFKDSEKDKYDVIKVELLNLQNDTALFNFTMPVLNGLSRKSQTFKKVSESIVTGDFEAIDVLKYERAIPEPIGLKMKENFKNKEGKYGSLLKYEPIGILRDKNGPGAIYQFHGRFIFEKMKVPYLLVLEVDETNDKFIGFNVLK
jgi:hypothetical protein